MRKRKTSDDKRVLKPRFSNQSKSGNKRRFNSNNNRNYGNSIKGSFISSKKRNNKSSGMSRFNSTRRGWDNGHGRNQRNDYHNKPNKTALILIVIALIAFVIGAGIGVSMALGGHEDADSAPQPTNVTDQMTSHVNHSNVNTSNYDYDYDDSYGYDDSNYESTDDSMY